ncbi:MAG: glycosyltransferase family 2 protein [bacterium]
MKKISIIIPCHNEEESLGILHSRLAKVIAGLEEEVEVIVIDDGSTDGTWKKIADIHNADGRWKAIRFSRNFGHQTAVSAGLDAVSGDAAIIMDADLQDPPEIIPEFIGKWREGYEVVYAVRRERNENFVKKFFYSLFYNMLSVLTNNQIPKESGDFGLMDKKVVDQIRSMPEHNRFVRGLRAWVGFRQAGVEYKRDKRMAGATQYTLKKLIKLAIDGFFSFSFLPLRAVTWLGIIVTVVSFAGAAFALLQMALYVRCAHAGYGAVPKLPLTLISIFFIGGVQMVCLGIIGEYIGRIYDEVRNRPLWVESERLGLSSRNKT